MVFADRELKEKEMLRAVIDMCHVCSIGFHDEPYPYVVPVNFGYVWESEPLMLYIHGARADGHMRKLMAQDNRVCAQMNKFIDRNLDASYRGENHDYRSVTVFGRMEEVEEEAEYVAALNAIRVHNDRSPIFCKAPKALRDQLCIWRITAEEITGKAQYPVSSVAEIEMPPHPSPLETVKEKK